MGLYRRRINTFYKIFLGFANFIPFLAGIIQTVVT